MVPPDFAIALSGPVTIPGFSISSKVPASDIPSGVGWYRTITLWFFRPVLRPRKLQPQSSWGGTWTHNLPVNSRLLYHWATQKGNKKTACGFLLHADGLYPYRSVLLLIECGVPVPLSKRNRKNPSVIWVNEREKITKRSCYPVNNNIKRACKINGPVCYIVPCVSIIPYACCHRSDHDFSPFLKYSYKQKSPCETIWNTYCFGQALP